MKSTASQIDALIIGGGLGGIAAALSLLERGFRVTLVEETDWLGGQLSSQAVPPDEHKWIENHGATSLYRKFRDKVRSYYQRNYPLAQPEQSNTLFNPGRAGVSRLSHEPRIAQEVIEEMLAPHVSSQRLHILRESAPIGADAMEETLRSVAFRNLRTGETFEIRARFFLDASETGDFLEIAKIDHVTGAEGSAETGEPHATSVEPRPTNMQAITWVAAIGYDARCPHDCDRYRIPKPELYSYWKNYIPSLTPPWPGKLIERQYSSPFTLKPVEAKIFPNLWIYRRIIASDNFAHPQSWNEATILNWPQNDYLEHDILLCSPEQRAERYKRARQLTTSCIYWLQTEVPREDGGAGYGGIHLRPDVTGTPDGLAKYPYIREARRIRSLRTITEFDVGVEAREGVPPEDFFDSIGTGYYRIDLHPTTGGDNYVDIESFPFQIPLGALISPRYTNFLAAGKNIGTTHISNGCYRLHPVEWNIGESAGVLAAASLSLGKTPEQIRNSPEALSGFQESLATSGIPIQWPESVIAEHEAQLSYRKPMVSL